MSVVSDLVSELHRDRLLWFVDIMVAVAVREGRIGFLSWSLVAHVLLNGIYSLVIHFHQSELLCAVQRCRN
jgi:hypothetical protein